ncbi:MAG: metallophosphoesterase, partial [Planctomycetota bacterium]|nr:metallophosphoesterase [Planctomycetota bacterium]
GDITNACTRQEWDNANRAMRVLDGVVPYFMVMGNHDYAACKPAGRDSTLFNECFGSHWFSKLSWYGGHFGEGNENAFYTFRAGGMDFLVVCLEFGPRDEVLQWADEIVAKNKTRRTIVVTHCYMYSDDTRVGAGDSANPHAYKCTNDGDELWEKFVKKHENIFLVLSGHILNDGTGRMTSTGDHGNKVHQVLANYQMRDGGDGWLRIMKFLPSEDRIVVSTYSPLTKQHATDEENDFRLEYEMERTWR